MKPHNYYAPLELIYDGAPISSPQNFVPNIMETDRDMAVVDKEFLLDLAKQMGTAHFEVIRNGIADRTYQTNDMPELINRLEKELTFLKSIQLVTEYRELETVKEAAELGCE